MFNGRIRTARRAAVLAMAAMFGILGAGGSAMASSTLTWGNFPAVSAEDRIDVNTTVNAVPGGQVTICLSAGPGVTWWKGVILRDWNGGVLRELDTQDGNHGPTCAANIAIADIKQIELWKAKVFGIHTQMYTLSQGTVYQKNGDLVEFRWQRDS